jgi:hypothetical protein
MAVFDEVCYSLAPSLSPTRRNELAAILDLNGAAPHPPYTHLIAPPASHAHNNATSDPAIKLVTERWVDRSVVMGKRQPCVYLPLFPVVYDVPSLGPSEQYYSPDPALIFSGVVACATDVRPLHIFLIFLRVTSDSYHVHPRFLWPTWRYSQQASLHSVVNGVPVSLAMSPISLPSAQAATRYPPLPHPPRSPSHPIIQYNTALHFAPQTQMCILTPHWFDDAVRLGRRIPETPYTWPDPPVLRPGMILDLDDAPLATDGRRRRKPDADTDAEAGDGSNVPNQGEHARVWAGRRILLSTSLELADGSRRAIEVRIQRAGGVIVHISEDADEDVEEEAVDECDVLVTRWRSGKSYFKVLKALLIIMPYSHILLVQAARASVLIGTLGWLFSVESSGTLHSPLDSLLWYPTPRGGIPDLTDCVRDSSSTVPFRPN